MQNETWSALSDLLAQLMAALLGVLAPPIVFDTLQPVPVVGTTGACTQGAFGLTPLPDAVDVACLDLDGSITVTATDGTAGQRRSATPLTFAYYAPLPVASDLNGDGRLDLMVLANTETTPQMYEPSCELVGLFGDGLGGFQLGTSQPIQSDPETGQSACSGFAAGDFDEDGVLDFVVTSNGKQADVYLTREHAAVFEQSFHLTNIHPSPESLVSEDGAGYQATGNPLVVDANGDGHADVVFLAGSNTYYYFSADAVAMHVFLGDGQGGFRSSFARHLGSHTFIHTLAAADFDADGHVDIAVTPLDPQDQSYEPTANLVAYGDGDGGFRDVREVSDVPVSGGMLATDYDGDGHVDLVTSDVQGSVFLHAGRGTREFEAPIGIGVASSPHWLGRLDFDHDGMDNLVVATSRGLEPIELPVDLEALGAPRVSSFSIGGSNYDVSFVLSDIDADSDADLVAANGNGLAVLENDGSGTLELRQIVLTDDALGGWAIGDLNRDGLPDVVAIVTGDIQLFIQRPDGSWEPGRFASSLQVSSHQLSGLFIADLNADGRADIVTRYTAVESYPYPAPVPATLLAISVQDESGRFAPPIQTPIDAWVTSVQDVDGDGRFDLAGNVYGLFGVLSGDGEGGFVLSRYVETDGAPSFVLADVDVDGRLDLVSTQAVYLANESGGFDPGVELPMDSPPWSVSVADLNGDGHPDIIAYSGEITVYAGLGDGAFGAAQPVHFPASSKPLAADLTADGLPELIVVSRGYSSAQLTQITNLSGAADGVRSSNAISSR